jgi:hypothetical protein
VGDVLKGIVLLGVRYKILPVLVGPTRVSESVSPSYSNAKPVSIPWRGTGDWDNKFATNQSIRYESFRHEDIL